MTMRKSSLIRGLGAAFTGLLLVLALIGCRDNDGPGTPKVDSIVIQRDGSAITELNATVGDGPITLTAAVLPTDAVQTVTWTSSNADIATVADGVVTIVGAGTTTITATSTADTTKSDSITLTVSQPSDPALTGTVTITGTAKVGETLTANITALNGEGAPSYQWKSADTSGGATTNIGTNQATYVLVAADAGKFISVTVSRTGFTGSITSAATAAVALPDLTGTVTITGTATVGETLTADISSLAGTGAPSYQWKSADTSGGATTNIGTNAATYTLAAADAGKFISVTVTRAGFAGDISSTATSSVALPAVTGVEIWYDNKSETELTVDEGQAPITLTAVVSPQLANQAVTWASSDAAVATVANGVVTIVGAGTVEITATSVQDNEKVGKITITVDPIAEEGKNFVSINLQHPVDQGLELEVVDGIAVRTIYKTGGTDKVIFEVDDASEDFVYTWYLGDVAFEGESVTFDAKDYGVGFYSVLLTVKKDDAFWSLPTTLGFTVVAVSE